MRKRKRTLQNETKNDDVFQRFSKFCSLVGAGSEAVDLKMKFAKHLGVPRMIQLKDQHKSIVEENIRPEFSIVKQSWINPRLMEPRQASQVEEKLQEAQTLKQMHTNFIQKTNDATVFSMSQL